MTGVNQELENAKTLLKKRNKSIRFADKSPAGWSAVEEYESDELADDSEDEKKLMSAERRALIKLRSRKQNRNSVQNRFKSSQEVSHHAAGAGSFRSQVSQPFRVQQQPFRQPQPSDKCFACGQFGHWANSQFCPSSSHFSNRRLPSSSSAAVNKQ